ncbi:MAG TPA: DUF4202 domain-containing protein [Polyangiaceae bacterium]
MTGSIDDALAQFAAIGAGDPRRVVWDGQELPRQLGEAACLLHYVRCLQPTPSLALQLATQCQHLRRYAYPRSEFPDGREGYLNWRKQAAHRSAEEAAAILRALGFETSLVEQVMSIITKQDRRRNPDCQAMEDALCLSFFRLDAPEFAAKHAVEEVERILRRTWLKMSEHGRTIALAERFVEPLRGALEALARDRTD